MSTEHCILELLRRHMAHGAVDETTLQRIASGLTGRLNDLGDAVRRKEGDPTFKTYGRKIRENNLSEVEGTIKAAALLYESSLCEEIKPQLNKLLWDLSALKCWLQVQPLDAVVAGLPKKPRLYLCVEIIVAWKLIKKTKEIPRRQKNAEQEPVGEFYEFIKALLSMAGILSVNIDELHRSIQVVAKKLENMKTDEPEIMTANGHQHGLWGKLPTQP